MNFIAGYHNIDFIMGVGDNFYNPDGVRSIDDINWDIHWADIYPA